MSVDHSVSRWIRRLEAGQEDEEAAQRLWERYFRALVEVAGRRLPRAVRRAFDEEDVALSAFKSLCRGVAERRFPDLADRRNLWSLLVVLTARKAARRLRAEQVRKRGGGRVRGESALGDAPGGDGIMRIIGDAPSPSFAAMVADESEQLLGFLDDPSLRTLALLKMEGLTNAEAAERLGCSIRTVERRLDLIRRLWVERATPAAGDPS